MIRTPIFSALPYLIKGRATTALKVGGVWEKLGTTLFPSCKQIYHFQIVSLSIPNGLSCSHGRIGVEGMREVIVMHHYNGCQNSRRI